MKKKIIDRVLAGVILLTLTVSNISPCLVYAEESRTESSEVEEQSEELVDESVQKAHRQKSRLIIRRKLLNMQRKIRLQLKKMIMIQLLGCE